MNEFVSIIMPSYNTANYIGEAIQSILNQTYPYWELIIVDDCSSDNTDEIVHNYQDERIHYLKNKKNSGAAISRNIALKEARGKWIAFLDSDDLWMPDKLEKQIKFMRNNSYHFSYTNYEEVDITLNPTKKIITGPKKITKHKMFNYCWPGCLTVMYDVEFVGLIQIENIKKNNDYAMWLKICKKTSCYLLNETLGQYRKGRSNSISSQKPILQIQWHYKLFRYAENQAVFIAIFNTIRNIIFGIYKKIRYVRKYK